MALTEEQVRNMAKKADAKSKEQEAFERAAINKVNEISQEVFIALVSHYNPDHIVIDKNGNIPHFKDFALRCATAATEAGVTFGNSVLGFGVQRNGTKESDAKSEAPNFSEEPTAFEPPQAEHVSPEQAS